MRKALIAITLVIGLVLVLASGTSAHGNILACFTLLPVFLFGLVFVPRSLWLPTESDCLIRHQLLARASLFQRPPPSA
jgi:hypothetical protein